MSCWTDQRKDFVRNASYKQTLAAEKISNDQFRSSYGIYDRALLLSGYPGEILGKISSFISPNSTLLDIGAGTGAFTIIERSGGKWASFQATDALLYLNR